MPPKLLPKSRYGTSIWIHLLLEKFHLQRPTQRTIEQLRLLGLSLAPGTITDGLKRIESLMTPVYEAIRTHHQLSTYFHADETRWRVFQEKAGKIGHRWWLWLFAGKDSVVFVLDPSRSHDVPQSHFADDVQGVLMVDRYSAYKAMQQVKDGQLVLAFCWAHVRRDFVRVGKGYPELKTWALQWLGRIRELYRLNRERLRHAPQTAEFAAADATLREHVALMAAQRDAELADDKLREPCRKTLVSLNEHWIGLTLFVDDPRIPLDNNYGERLIRNPAVGRKNYYGSGAEWAGRLAVMMFSIFATLIFWKINPRKWLSWYFDACAVSGGNGPDDPASYLPWNLSETRLAELQSSTSSEASPENP
jgi:transposase